MNPKTRILGTMVHLLNVLTLVGKSMSVGISYSVLVTRRERAGGKNPRIKSAQKDGKRISTTFMK